MRWRRPPFAARFLVVAVAAHAHLVPPPRELFDGAGVAVAELADASISGGRKPELPCAAPVQRARVEFPEHLIIGDAADGVEMYSGYVNVTSEDYLFYWFMEADSGAPDDAPLIIWTNGGPGCSSMEGVTTEHGPLVLFGIKEDSMVSPAKLSRNPYAWNREAHVLYVDQPRYVGFSCGTGPFLTSSVAAGLDMVNFIRGWHNLFPEHAHRDVILAAESYGGHFIPAWSSAILDYNSAGVAEPIRLTGLIIGNGIVNETIQGRTFPEFAKRQGLIPKNLSVESSWGAREIMTDYIGYEPNYYDYRLAEHGCCGCSAYNYKYWSDFMMREDVTKALNVCGDAGAKAFGGCAAGCIQLPAFDKNDLFSYSGAIARALEQGIQVTFYYGMQDTACNYVGGYAMAEMLEWHGSEHFRAAPMEDLIVGGIPAGGQKAFGGLTWIQIEGAGHMVPINNPAAAYHAVGTLVRARRGQSREGPAAVPPQWGGRGGHAPLPTSLDTPRISEWMDRLSPLIPHTEVVYRLGIFGLLGLLSPLLVAAAVATQRYGGPWAAAVHFRRRPAAFGYSRGVSDRFGPDQLLEADL